MEYCYDCQKKIEISDNGDIENGVKLIYEKNDKKVKIFKCNRCFEKSESWSQKCEVYSRIVGYLRPVQDWNPAKSQEFKERKTFTV